MEIWLLQAALLFYLLSTVGFVLALLSEHAFFRTLAPLLLLGAFILHVGAITARSVDAGYIAVTNFYEAVSFFACLTTGICLLVQWRTPVSILGAVVSPLGFVLTLGVFIFYSHVRDLPQNLHSVWLPVHVILAFLGNAVFCLAFSVSLVYLVQEKQLKGKKVGAFFRRLPSLETLDDLNYHSLVWGFGLLTLGILTGAVWAEFSWGQFWIWEPRPVLSLVTWILYGLLLHYRTVGWRGRRAATLTIACFAILVASFLSVNLLFSGRHGGQYG